MGSKNPLLLQENTEAKTLAEKMEQSKHLIKSFGQAKGQRFYDQQDRMRVDTCEAGENVMQNFKTLEELKECQKGRQLSALGVEFLNKCNNMEGDVGNRAAITLYMEGIIMFSRLRQGEMRKGEKSLQQFLPLNIK